jgi:hypothetical protein
MKRFKVLFPLCTAVLAVAAVVVIWPRPAEAIALSALSAKPEPVFIDIHDFAVSDDTAVGTFEASGAIETSGDESQVFRINGVTLHCVHTLTAAEGTIVIRSQCNLNTNVGHWRVVSGTGAYAGLKGNGSLLMVFNPDDPAEAHELLDGRVH